MLGLGIPPSPTARRTPYSTLDLIPKLSGEILGGVSVAVAATG